MGASADGALALPLPSRIPTPASWLKVDAPRVPITVIVTVELPQTRVSYLRRVKSVFDAYDDALTRYRDCIRIAVEPIKRVAS